MEGSPQSCISFLRSPTERMSVRAVRWQPAVDGVDPSLAQSKQPVGQTLLILFCIEAILTLTMASRLLPHAKGYDWR